MVKRQTAMAMVITTLRVPVRYGCHTHWQVASPAIDECLVGTVAVIRKMSTQGEGRQ